VLVSGMGQPSDQQFTNIYVYTSRNKESIVAPIGHIFRANSVQLYLGYVSQVALGGRADTTNDANPLRKPSHLMLPVSHNLAWFL
jgi:hypothetical protein